MMSSWNLQYSLHDADNKPVGDLFPFPVSTNDAPSASPAEGRGRDPSVPYTLTDLCTLPPADLAQSIPPHLIDPSNGCVGRFSSSPSALTSCQSFHRSEAVLDSNCIWNGLTRRYALNGEPGPFCLPLDNPVLAVRGVVAVPNLTGENRESWGSHPPIGSVLKHQLQLRNHSAANLPVFANVTVRPGHKRLRLGVCVPFPPVGAPCSISAIDSSTGTVANDWLFPWSHRVFLSQFQASNQLDISLARPHTSFSLLAGPNLGTLDHVGTLAPPFPFITFRASQQATRDASWGPSKAWAIPLVGCAAAGNSTSSSLGVIRPLVIDGACSTGRDCLSGVCHASNKTCDNSIKPDTQSPFSSTFVINDQSRPLTFPSSVTLRQTIEKHAQDSEDSLPSEASYYLPLIIASGVVIAILFVTAVWTESGQRYVRKWTSGWRTTTQRDMELKPVTGAMVADLGDERAVQEALDAGAEELPVYAEQRQE